MTLIELTIYAALAEWLILGVILLVGIRGGTRSSATVR